MAEKTDHDNGLITARRFFANTASTYDRCVRLWTLGQDRWWKKAILEQIPPDSIRLLDQACGTGILTLQIARRFPRGRIVGVDLHRDYLSLAMKKARAMGLNNVRWIHGRAEDVVLKGQYDCITSSYLAKYADLDRLVWGAGKMLRKGGSIVMHDFTYPRIRLLSSALRLWFFIMRNIGYYAFPDWKTAFNELEGFLRQSRWVPALIRVLRKNPFGRIRLKRLTFGFATLVLAEKM